MERLLEYFVPENYQLNLNIDKHKKTLQGKVIITGVAKKSTIKLHAVDFIVDDVKGFSFKQEDGTLIIKQISLGENVLEITYHGNLNENMQGAYLSTYKNKGKEEVLVATQFESHYARECFPCVDEPAAKATFDLSITIPDPDDIILANTPIKNVVKNTTVFETTPRMSTYLLAFVIGKFHSKTTTNKHGVKVTSYCALNHSPKVLDYANDTAARALDYYDDLFGVPYPLPKMDQVALPDFEAGAMENWGLVTYRESCMLADDSTSMDSKEYIATVITHELSHQWFGDLVTMAWWDDLWLNESFASVIEYFAADFLYPEYDIWRSFFTGDCLAALTRDAYFGVQSVKQDVNDPAEIATLFDGAIVYAKGARLMFMLIRLMGQEKFFAGIREYFEKYKYQNTVGDDLWASLQPHADFDVKEFMDTWISQLGYPVVTDGEQKRFLLSGKSDDSEWPLPEIKDDMSGHYLINLPEQEFEKTLQNFANLSLEQKLRLLIDRMLLSKTSLVPTISLLKLLPNFKEETSYPVWEIISSIINSLKVFYPPKSEHEQDFRGYINDLIETQLNRLGAEQKKNEPSNDTKLRCVVLSLAIYAKNSEVIEKLASFYQPDYEKIDSDTRFAILRSKFLNSNEEIFADLLEKYQNTVGPDIKDDILAVLTTTKEPKNIDEMIKILHNSKIVRPQDHMYLYVYLRRNYHTKSKAFDWLIENWQYVCQMNGEKSIEDYPRLTASTIYDKAEQAKFVEFFDKLAENPALKRAIAVAKPEIQSKIDWISLNSQDMTDFFKKSSK